ncbi:helix-turn-helix transcriptional regulator [Deinococcus sp. 6GRE01]|uniref:helix-turn-helix domain-containing protein n=1 Tax=Deinococcus sp. 6GRE01 TaxID=2745873 RepID=UPI001E44DA66|nr:helix-turn-helix transcriptional regulator [Deinococcus sp. 6GRE01]MCD0157179.1 XRE family transcriptional regulator [Deinococcus sp. 6GRE01]
MSRGKAAASELASLRKSKGLSQEEIASRISQISGEEVGQAAVSYWELGKVDLRKVHPRRVRAYAQALGVSPAQLSQAAGLEEAELFSDTLPAATHSAASRGYRVPDASPTPIPDELLEAAALFGSSPELAGLREHRWQAWMASVPHRKRPATPGEWLDFYMRVKDTIDPPEIAH